MFLVQRGKSGAIKRGSVPVPRAPTGMVMLVSRGPLVTVDKSTTNTPISANAHKDSIGMAIIASLALEDNTGVPLSKSASAPMALIGSVFHAFLAKLGSIGMGQSVSVVWEDRSGTLTSKHVNAPKAITGMTIAVSSAPMVKSGTPKPTNAPVPTAKTGMASPVWCVMVAGYGTRPSMTVHALMTSTGMVTSALIAQAASIGTVITALVAREAKYGTVS